MKNWLKQKNVKFHDFIVDKQKIHFSYDVLVDDSPSYIGQGTKVLLYDRPYNENAETGRNSWRANSFSEARRYIERELV